MAVTWKQIAFISDDAYGDSWNGVVDEAPSKNVVYDEMKTKSDKTTAAWSKSIGSGGDYATWTAMVADMPDLIAHAVTVTIKAGTTLTETCNLKNKHGLTNEAIIRTKAEKYFPDSGDIPTADSATSTTLRDAALATAAKGDDYFNGCWVFIVDGTGTDNGYVPITDYIDSTGDVVVASWPGTQPDATSRYLIIGALVDGQATRKYCVDINSNTCRMSFYGIGFYNSTNTGCRVFGSTNTAFIYCGIYQVKYCGLWLFYTGNNETRYCGIVNNNIANYSEGAGVLVSGSYYVEVQYCGISDNNQRGLYSVNGSFLSASNNFGDANGTWGSYAQYSGQTRIVGIECSGSSGNHSDPGTAGTASADQAVIY